MYSNKLPNPFLFYAALLCFVFNLLLSNSNQLQAQQTWYSLNSGDWNDDPVNRWTLDPSGNLPDNPNADTPGVDDIVVILNGNNIEIDNNHKKVAGLQVFGSLDLKSTEGHEFGEVEGTGTIRLSSGNLPINANNPFVAAQGGGRVVFYGDQDITLDNVDGLHFYDLSLNLNNAKLIQKADFKINNELILQSGNLQINDDVSTTKLKLEIENNFLINQGALLSVGKGDLRNGYSIDDGNVPSGNDYNKIFHEVVVNGSMENNGSIKLINLDFPVYNEFPSNGAATLWFTGGSDESFDINDTTYLYALIVDKGTDKTYELKMNSSSRNHFVLFGPNNVGGDAGSANAFNRKALNINNGTLRLTGHFFIPTLTEGGIGGNGDFRIRGSARLWIDGENVEIFTTVSDSTTSNNPQLDFSQSAASVDIGGASKALSIFGDLKITDGLLNTRNSAGIIYWNTSSAILDIRGGLIEASQIRSGGGLASTGVSSYLQSGGKVSIRGDDMPGNWIAWDRGRSLFDIDNSDGVFNMTGGILEIINVSRDASPNGFRVLSGRSNLNVSGGEIIFEIDGTTRSFSDLRTQDVLEFELSCACTFNKITIKRKNTSGIVYAFTHNQLNVRNLNIGDHVHLYAQTSFDDPTYHDISIADTLTLGGVNSILEASQSVLTFRQERRNSNLNIGPKSSWNDGAGSDVSDLKVKDLVIDKESANFTINSPGRAAADSIIAIITGDLRVLSGNTNLNDFTLQVEENITLNAPLLGGTLLLKGVEEQIISPPLAQSGELDGLVIDNSEGVRLNNGKLQVNKYLVLNEGILNIGTQELHLDYNGEVGTANSNGFDENLMIQTEGNPNDGGLRKRISGNGTHYYPIGVAGKYTPVELAFTNNPQANQTVKINPADRKLATLTGDQDTRLDYYWQIIHDFNNDPSDVNITLFDDVNDRPGITDGDSLVVGRVVDVDREVLSGFGFGTNDNLSVNDITLKSGTYTAAYGVNFVGQVEVFYTRRAVGFGGADWSENSTWSTVDHSGPAASRTPGSGDLVRIGYSTNSTNFHVVNVDIDNLEVAGVRFAERPSNATSLSRLRLEENVTNIDLTKIEGMGVIQVFLDDIAPNISGDFTDFTATPNSRFNYTKVGNSSSVKLPNSPNVYRLLRVQGNNNQVVEMPDVPISILEDLWMTQGAIIHSSTEEGASVVIGRNFRVGNNGGEEFYFAAGDHAAQYEIKGDIEISNASKLAVEDATHTGSPHLLSFHGNIEIEDANSSINLSKANNQAILKAVGENSQSITRDGGNIPEFYQLEVDKTGGELSLSTEALFGSNNSIKMERGTLVMNNDDLEVTLANGSDFDIPRDATLVLEAGSYYVKGDETRLFLDGTLNLKNNAQLFLFDEDNVDDAISFVYTSSGNATFSIADNALLKVAHQFRRPIGNNSGVLDFTQSGGEIQVGMGSAGNEIDISNGRGFFELMNSGSRFSVSGGKLLVGKTLPGFIATAEVIITPGAFIESENWSLEFGEEISNVSDNTFDINIGIPIGNLKANDRGDGSLTVKPIVNNLRLLGNLIIENRSTLDLNNFNLEIGGDFINQRGTDGFNARNGLVTFNGNNSVLEGTTTFHNLNIEVDGGLNLSSNTTSEITIENRLNLLSGTLNDGGNRINVKGNLENGSTHISPQSSGGIVMNGDARQQIFNDGTYGILEIDNEDGILMPDPPLNSSNSITVNDVLRLTNGRLNIRGNLLTLNQVGTELQGAPFSADKMIETNISFTDAGVRKIYDDNVNEFVYPVGSGGKYTPITLNLTDINSGAAITVRAANEPHPGIEGDALDSVLQYHWSVNTINLSTFDGTLKFNFDNDDIRGDINEYGPAFLDENDIAWQKSLPDWSLDIPNEEMVFNFNVTDIAGDYTAGDTSSLPDSVRSFVSTGSGAWDDLNNWDPTPPVGGPQTSRVVVAEGDEITLNQSNRRIISTVIEEGGRLIINDISNQNLGDVSGKGTLVLTGGDLPTGNYASFFDCEDGGVLEFSGSSNYQISSNALNVSVMVISGSGERRIPNGDLNVCNNLTLESGGATLINDNNRTISVQGNLIIENGGAIDPGVGSGATVRMNGSSRQKIEGEFTGNNALNNLRIQNSEDVEIEGAVEVRRRLLLSEGNVITDNNNSLTLRVNATVEPELGRNNSYVSGPLKKRLNAGNSFNFPVGKGTNRPIGLVNASEETWEAEYFEDNPQSQVGSDVNLGTGSTGFGPDGGVSSLEYWTVETPTSSTANGVRLYWNTNSSVDDVNFVHVAEYDGGQWLNRGANNIQGTPNSGSITSGSVSFSKKEFTFGSTNLSVTPLPVELVSFSAEEERGRVRLDWMTASEVDNSHFIIERSEDGREVEEIGMVYSKASGGNSVHKLSYRYFDESPIMGRSYYRLKQVDYDGTYEYSEWQMVEFIRVAEMDMRIYPNPSRGDNLTIEIETNFRAEDLELQLYDLKGSLKWHQKLPLTDEQNFYKSDLNFGRPLNKGVYLLRMTTKDETVVKKLIVQ